MSYMSFDIDDRSIPADTEVVDALPVTIYETARAVAEIRTIDGLDAEMTYGPPGMFVQIKTDDPGILCVVFYVPTRRVAVEDGGEVVVDAHWQSLHPSLQGKRFRSSLLAFMSDYEARVAEQAVVS